MSVRKLALVTGSTSGIGLAIARVLAGNGIEVILHGLESPEEGEAVADSIAAESGQRPTYFQCDLSQPEAIEQLMQRIAQQVGDPTIVVNNAGIQFTAPVQEFPPATWDKIIAINLNAAFHTTRLALPGMIQAGWGRIINISSVHGLVASEHKAAYCAAKHGWSVSPGSRRWKPPPRGSPPTASAQAGPIPRCWWNSSTTSPNKTTPATRKPSGG